MIHSRLHRLALLILIFAALNSAGAQADSTVAAPPPPPAADTLRPPISPGRAFLQSLIIPGSAQNRLGRHRVAVGIIGVEAMSIAMIRESGFDVREARRQRGDSIVVSWVDDNGARLTTPIVERRRFADEEVASRRSHVEDWVALLIANHLFAAADAFVAASLWDVDARVTVNGNRSRFVVMAQFPW
ncbi:MAG TPA: hypothetical protein VFO55_14565 [Gemmatimonadaceae bacterium]|nr:hypothetical protein [Gemmatimonadaceae bacterium]